ncbi:MAG: flagellar protein FlaG [Alphaproteobacteria bacterium]
MPEITGIAASNVAPPREIKPQRATATELTNQSKPTANPTRPDDSKAVARDEKVSRPEPEQKPASEAAEKPVSSPYKARLNYDIENEDIYIEIISPRTGEVLQRLPPEDALDPLLKTTDGKIGAVLDQVA